VRLPLANIRAFSVVMALSVVVLVLSMSTSRAAARYLTIRGQRALVLTPSHPTDRLVIYVHGAGGTASTIAEPGVNSLTKPLLARGFAVAASDAHGTENWGNPPSVADYVRLAHRLRYPRIYILAHSMGGLDAVQLIDKLHPEAWAGIFPVCNAKSVFRRGEGAGRRVLGPPSLLSKELTKEIRSVYGGPPPHALSPVKARNVAGLPVLIWASPADTVVPFGQNAAECAKWMSKGGANVRVVKTVGDHGDPSNIRPRWLADFMSRSSAKQRPGGEARKPRDAESQTPLLLRAIAAIAAVVRVL
jgi:fermentation-respiration switch protein FrsA (DUF1100 family)